MHNIKNISNKNSKWIKKHLPKVNKNKILLDLASGNGRHSLFAQSLGYKVVSADINLNKLKKIDNDNILNININFEIEYNWVFKDNIFDAIIVTNYLYRNLLKKIYNSLKYNGILLYETFTIENIEFGRPNNHNFLLKPQELLNFAKNYNMQVINYEEKIINTPQKAIQRIFCKKLTPP